MNFEVCFVITLLIICDIVNRWFLLRIPKLPHRDEEAYNNETPSKLILNLIRYTFIIFYFAKQYSRRMQRHHVWDLTFIGRVITKEPTKGFNDTKRISIKKFQIFIVLLIF